MLEDGQSLWHELRGLTHDRFLLATLETQRAGKSLVDMIVAGVMVGVLLIGALRRLNLSSAAYAKPAIAQKCRLITITNCLYRLD